MKQRNTIKVGDRVAYTHEWLKNACGYLCYDISRARGTVTHTQTLGTTTTLAHVQWEQGDFPPKVLTSNLCKAPKGKAVQDSTT